jgi:hypothetical protein
VQGYKWGVIGGAIVCVCKCVCVCERVCGEGDAGVSTNDIFTGLFLQVDIEGDATRSREK